MLHKPVNIIHIPTHVYIYIMSNDIDIYVYKYIYIHYQKMILPCIYIKYPASG